MGKAKTGSVARLNDVVVPGVKLAGAAHAEGYPRQGEPERTEQPRSRRARSQDICAIRPALDAARSRLVAPHRPIGPIAARGKGFVE